MNAASQLAPDSKTPQDPSPSDVDQVIFMYDLTWSDFERILAMRGDVSRPRYTFNEGTLEIMSPSNDHEQTKSHVGRLVEVWCLHRDVEFRTRGSWTLKRKKVKRAVEADECYIFTDPGDGPEVLPDLAIEVFKTSGRIDKLDVYRKLGVREVWIWRRSSIRIHALRGDVYEVIDASEVLPGIDLVELCQYAEMPSTSACMKAYRKALEAKA